MFRSSLSGLLLAFSIAAASPVFADHYQTNPSLGASATITIDGVNNGEWTSDHLIALDMANDDPRTLGDGWSMHETPFDLTHLYAAWDDTNLYIAWQYVDVTDVVDPANAGSAGGANPGVMDLIQWIAIDTIEDEGASLDMWGKNGGDPYWTGRDLPDFQIYVAGNLWQGFVSEASAGVFPVDAQGYSTLAEAGIEVAVSSGLASDSLWGALDVDDAGDPDMIVDFLAQGHIGNRDAFYEMSIPLAHLGFTRAALEADGLGLMLGQGEQSCVDTIPHDPATLDTVGTSDSNSPLEWGDNDALSVDFARVAAYPSGTPDPCAGVVCETGERCENGACVPDQIEEDISQDLDVHEDNNQPADTQEDTASDQPDVSTPTDRVYWTPNEPMNGDTITIYVPGGAGWLHWGVNDWQEPDPSSWAEGTFIASAGQAVETPLSEPNPDGMRTAQIHTRGEIEHINFVIHYADDTWDNNNGEDYLIYVSNPLDGAGTGTDNHHQSDANGDLSPAPTPIGDKDDDDGCGCQLRAARDPAPIWPLSLSLAILGLLWWRRPRD